MLCLPAVKDLYPPADKTKTIKNPLKSMGGRAPGGRLPLSEGIILFKAINLKKLFCANIK